MKVNNIWMLQDRSLLFDEGMLQLRSLLLVDNDEQLVDLIKEILEYQGFNVVPVYCGVAAVERAREGRYFCAILDYALPDMKGDELAEIIRLEQPNIKLILLTGFKSSIDPVKLTKFNYVMEKPVKLDALIAVVKQITGAKRQGYERINALRDNKYPLDGY